ncbi:unnamed protein product [Penicillium camemberti]|uniref:Str. FM013 n=1 Tax=Penicillium camemberti (strain FM 013) TaxID=1429867 RepID=A0A0G4PL53_PENC3|nr:unnamed protein product [Penicillium camemberti]
MSRQVGCSKARRHCDIVDVRSCRRVLLKASRRVVTTNKGVSTGISIWKAPSFGQTLQSNLLTSLTIRR